MARIAARAVLAAVAVAVTLAGLAPAGADARHQSRTKAIWGPAQVDGVSQFPIYRDLGVGIWQRSLSWAGVARTRPAEPRDPDDPAYTWPAELDQAVREARRNRMRVMINLTQAPEWANGGRASNWAPEREQDFADFAAAASRRYPGVHLWQVWSEPTREGSFRVSGGATATARVYAEILDRSYGWLKRVSGRNQVIGGNTFTAGDIRPRSFLRRLSYRRGGRLRRPRLDMWGHNPFGPRRPFLRDDPLADGLVDWAGLDELARLIDRVYPPREQPRRQAVELYIAEYTMPTGHRSTFFDFFGSNRLAASYLKSAYKIATGWRRIYTVGWFELYDRQPNAEGNEPRLGLLTAGGRKKSAYHAYRRVRGR